MPYRHDVLLSYLRDSFRHDCVIMDVIPVFDSKVREAIAAATPAVCIDGCATPNLQPLADHTAALAPMGSVRL